MHAIRFGLTLKQIEGMTTVEREMFSNSFIMYQSGKGINHLVPVLVPTDCIEAVHKLCNMSLREDCGIRSDNDYIFPSTLGSEANVSGWHALNRVCQKGGVSNNFINATKMRHLTSSMYASLVVPESQRAAFYSHMGHSRTINEQVYQCPLAEVEIRNVGAVLEKFGKSFLFIIDTIVLYIIVSLQTHYNRGCIVLNLQDSTCIYID